MDIRFIKQTDNDFRQGIDMLRSNLPKIQTLPDFVMRLLLLNPNSHLIGLYEKDKQIGTGFVSENSKMAYLMYLVVLPEYRRCGYGSAFFTWIKEYAHGRSVVGNVEKPEQTMSFLKSTSNIDTGYIRTILGHEYSIFCLNGFDLTEYKKLAKSIYFGFNPVTIKKKT